LILLAHQGAHGDRHGKASREVSMTRPVAGVASKKLLAPPESCLRRVAIGKIRHARLFRQIDKVKISKGPLTASNKLQESWGAFVKAPQNPLVRRYHL